MIVEVLWTNFPTVLGLLNLAFRLTELCSTSAGHNDTNYTSKV